MKKTFLWMTLVILACGTLSACTGEILGSGLIPDGSGSNIGHTIIDGTTDVSKIPTQTVTATEWKAALSESSFENFTMTRAYAAGMGGMEYRVTKDAVYNMMMASDDENSVNAGVYIKNTDGTVDFYQTENKNEPWKRSKATEEQFQAVRKSVYTNMFSELAEKFSKAEYDAEGGYYMVTVTLSVVDFSYDTQYCLKFMDGKLFALGSVNHIANQEVITYMNVYNYGTTVVTPPENFVDAKNS